MEISLLYLFIYFSHKITFLWLNFLSMYKCRKDTNNHVISWWRQMSPEGQKREKLKAMQSKSKSNRNVSCKVRKKKQLFSLVENPSLGLEYTSFSNTTEEQKYLQWASQRQQRRSGETNNGIRAVNALRNIFFSHHDPGPGWHTSGQSNRRVRPDRFSLRAGKANSYLLT